MGKYFGTDGVRGIANRDLTNELAYKLGRYGSYVLTKNKGHGKARIIVGKDPRISGDMLEASLIAGILSVGSDAVKIGVVPTPAVAYLVREEGFDAGVMISASHNSYEYNGIKFFSGDGFKLSDEIEAEIEEYIDGIKEIEEEFVGDALGEVHEDMYLRYRYLEHAKSAVKNSFEGLKILLDTANGSAYELAEIAFRDMGAYVTVINNTLDGVNINYNCGSTHMGELAKKVVAGGFDLGLAFDGDADRLLAIDSKGNEVDGDRIMGICALNMKNEGTLKGNGLVTTVMSNIGLFRYLESIEIDSVKTKVGDRYVLEKMKSDGYAIGGEQSGHIILLDYNSTGDGILTGLVFVDSLLSLGKNIDVLSDEIVKYPQVLLNAIVDKDKKHTYLENEHIVTRINEIESELHGTGRILVRPSGTEPLVRVMLEGEDITLLEKYAKELVALYEEELG